MPGSRSAKEALSNSNKAIKDAAKSAGPMVDSVRDPMDLIKKKRKAKKPAESSGSGYTPANIGIRG